MSWANCRVDFPCPAMAQMNIWGVIKRIVKRNLILVSTIKFIYMTLLNGICHY